MAATLSTSRLSLRQWQDSDRAPWAAMNADKEVRKFFPNVLNRAQSDAFVDRASTVLDEVGYGLWAAELRDSGEFIGFVGLAPVRFSAPFTPTTEIGWRLARPFWGLGLATEGASHVLRFAFHELVFDEVVSFTPKDNVRSWHVMERIGMRRVPKGDFDHPDVPNNLLQRHILYRITRLQWQSIAKANNHNTAL